MKKYDSAWSQGSKVRQGPLHGDFFMDKGSISSILALFRQNRNYGYSAQIDITKKNVLYHPN